MKKNFKKQKGITLIALIITIIVMLILVAVTINMAINGGLFEQAGKAVGEMQNAVNKEQELANGQIAVDGKVYNSIDDYLAGKVAVLPYDETAKDSKGLLIANATYTSGEYTAVVPKGFKVIPGINGSTSISDGLVIQDAEGNEFVWIPVTIAGTTQAEKEASFETIRKDGYLNGNLQTMVSGGTVTEPYASGYSDGNGTEEAKEYKEMRTSIIENGGFYIGRYEAGIKTTESPRTASTTGKSNMVVQRDCYPYIYVGWGGAMNDYTSDVIWNTSSHNQTNGSNFGKGALYLSKHMYDEKDIGATSTLCYGIQWDAMLDFVKDSTHNVTNSTNWGNHNNNPWTITRTTAKYATLNKGTNELEEWTPVPVAGKGKTSSESILLTTGANDSFAAKNIYDVAGNVAEWTNEASSSSYRVSRGGNYYFYGCDYPASCRSGNPPFYCTFNLGFRPSLYIK